MHEHGIEERDETGSSHKTRETASSEREAAKRTEAPGERAKRHDGERAHNTRQVSAHGEQAQPSTQTAQGEGTAKKDEEAQKGQTTSKQEETAREQTRKTREETESERGETRQNRQEGKERAKTERRENGTHGEAGNGADHLHRGKCSGWGGRSSKQGEKSSYSSRGRGRL